MTFPTFWNQSWTAALVNHLWQSTAVVGIAWLLAWALRKNHARVRYWIWFAASVKFLLPFSLLIAAGEWLRSLIAVPAAQPAITAVMEQVTQPFAAAQFFGTTGPADTADPRNFLQVLLLAIWACGTLIVLARMGRGWMRVRAAARASLPLPITADVPVLGSPAPIEPGIFGILRPVLLVPEGILERLTAEQLRAIIAHEMCHVHRRDNLTYAIHMIVESLFWFHPAVWWIGARLIDERERACDEAVVEAGGEAQTYAEGILKVCRFYVESPVACVAGVTGADLKKRIAHIMMERIARKLSLSRKLLLGLAGLVALAVPVAMGVVHAAQIRNGDSAAQSNPLRFAVVSIRPNKTGGRQQFGEATPDGYRMTNMFMEAPLLQAYAPPTGGGAFYRSEEIVGLPAWTNIDRYDIDAKIDPADLTDWQNPAKQRVMQREMLQAMLADRLKLVVHRSTKEVPVYLLVVGKHGPKFKATIPGEPHPGALTGPIPGGGVLTVETQGGERTVHYFGITTGQLANFVLGGSGRPIEDKTGLTGRYDITVQKPVPVTAPVGEQEGVSLPEPEPSAFTVAGELGLKLEPGKGSVGVLVIDHIEQPSPN